MYVVKESFLEVQKFGSAKDDHRHSMLRIRFQKLVFRKIAIDSTLTMIEEWSNRKSRRSDHFTTQFFTSAKLINEKSGRKLRSGRGALPSAAARRAVYHNVHA